MSHQCLLSLIIALLVPAWSQAANFSYERKYKIGEKFGYKYQRIQKTEGQPDIRVNGRTKHEVSMVDLMPSELVTWTSFVETTAAGLRDRTAELKDLPAFLVALPPGGRSASIEKLPYPLSEFSYDLLRFYQGIETIFLGTFLKKTGDRYAYPQPIRGRSGGPGAAPPWPQYADCFERSIELVSWMPAEKRAKLQIRNVPPSNCTGFVFPAQVMNAAPGAKPNNVGSISMNNGRYDLHWGVEERTLDLEIDSESGLLLQAKEEIVYKVNFRNGCDSSFQNCQGARPVAPPVEQRRVTELKLVR